ncbi:hypothetical protein [Streptomyces sp. P9-A2]|uniref:hypothetical protein n=1 Tax=Streptomyces sp. P9-A2 TaxID=3072284 RepID=UPI002FCBAD95
MGTGTLDRGGPAPGVPPVRSTGLLDERARADDGAALLGRSPAPPEEDGSPEWTHAGPDRMR